MNYVCTFSISITAHLSSCVSHDKTPLHCHQVEAMEVIQPECKVKCSQTWKESRFHISPSTFQHNWIQITSNKPSFHVPPSKDISTSTSSCSWVRSSGRRWRPSSKRPLPPGRRRGLSDPFDLCWSWDFFFQKHLSCYPFEYKFEVELVDKGQLQSGFVIKGVVNYLIFLSVVGGLGV